MTVDLTDAEIGVIVALVDAGVRATGVQVFRGKHGAALQSALDKMQAAAAPTQDDAEPDE